MPFNKRTKHDPTGKLRARNLPALPVSSFYQHIGTNQVDKLLRGVFVEEGHPIHSFHRRKHNSPGELVLNRTPRALQSSNRIVRVQADNKNIALRFGKLEDLNMARMNQIETSVREHNGLSAGSESAHPVEQLGPRENLG